MSRADVKDVLPHDVV